MVELIYVSFIFEVSSLLLFIFFICVLGSNVLLMGDNIVGEIFLMLEELSNYVEIIDF